MVGMSGGSMTNVDGECHPAIRGGEDGISKMQTIRWTIGTTQVGWPRQHRHEVVTAMEGEYKHSSQSWNVIADRTTPNPPEEVDAVAIIAQAIAVCAAARVDGGRVKVEPVRRRQWACSIDACKHCNGDGGDWV